MYKCTKFEIYKLRLATQEANKPIDTFHTRLRKLSENCEFDSNDKEIKSQIIQGCASTRLRHKEIKSQIIQGCASTRLRRKALRDDMT